MILTNLSMTRIKNLRIDHDYCQKQVASYLSISRSSYSQVECELRELQKDEVEKLAILYDVVPQYLLGYIDTPIPYPKHFKDEVKEKLNIYDNKINSIFNKNQKSRL
ncbi:MAG: helix-turn-helix transcriptional regulator [Bacilli bacterium]|nr:helix-turn-helix transcriptional regulator [Bacilli bacterium]